MTIDQIRYFLAIAETGSFTRAAKRCGIAQPSLSQQIAQLERHLKRRLFDRLPRKILLTHAGQELLPRARRLIEAAENLAASPAHSALRGPLSVGAVSTVAPFVVAETLVTLVRKHPAVHASLEEMPTDLILDRVRSGACDVGIVVGDVTDPQLLAQTLFSELLVLALPRGHRLAAQNEVTLDQLAREPLILLDELAHILPARTRRNPGPLRGSGLHISTIEALVRKGAGLCLLPAMATRTRKSPGILYRPIRDPSGKAAREVTAIWHRDRVRTAPALTFMDLLRTTIARIL